MIIINSETTQGHNNIEVHYNPDGGDESKYFTKKFNITIQDSRTDFDAVIQEVSDSDVSVAIANIGKYTANSVVVRIPEQKDFRVTGTDGQMVGNLDSGDYTIVSFSLTPTMQRKAQTGDSNESIKKELQNQESNLNFDVYYTDSLGERRVVNMELPLKMESTILSSLENGFAGGNRARNTSSLWSIWHTAAVVFVLIVIAFVLYKKYSKRKLAKLHDKESSNTIPNWMNNVKDKGKKK